MTNTNKEMLKKIATVVLCMIVFITVGVVVINFQSKVITLDYYGQKVKVVTMSNTIEGMMMQNGIYIDSRAIVYPSKDTLLENNMCVRIYTEDDSAKLDLESLVANAKNNIKEVFVIENQNIDFEVEEKANASVSRGEVKTIQAGVTGEKEVTYTTQYLDGEVINESVLDEIILAEAQNQIIEVGTSLNSVSRGSVNRVTAEDISVDSNFVLYNIKLDEDLQRYTYNQCKTYGVPYETMLAVMYVESGFNANAYSSTDDYGICQINGCNYTFLVNNLGISDLYNPYDNIKAGVYWLSRYYSYWAKYDTGELLERNALNSYNFGTAGYLNYLSKGGTAYSWRYANRIIQVKNNLLEKGSV